MTQTRFVGLFALAGASLFLAQPAAAAKAGAKVEAAPKAASALSTPKDRELLCLHPETMKKIHGHSTCGPNPGCGLGRMIKSHRCSKHGPAGTHQFHRVCVKAVVCEVNTTYHVHRETREKPCVCPAGHPFTEVASSTGMMGKFKCKR